MGTTNREVVARPAPVLPPFGVKLYCLSTAIGMFVLIPTSWGVSPAFGVVTTVVTVFHLLSIYGLWNMYLVGLDLAVVLNLVSILGAIVVGSFTGIVLPIVFIVYLRHVRVYYL